MQEDTKHRATWHSGGLVSIGALARRVGISPDTLRAWERRHGQPVPVRLPSGHRRYPPEAVHHMQCVAALLAEGWRPGELLKLPTAELEARLRTEHQAESRRRIGPWLELCESYRAHELTEALVREGEPSHPEHFLSRRVLPLLREIDRRRSSGTLGPRHTQLAISALRECLHILRHRRNARASGPRLVVAPFAQQRSALTALMLSYLASSAGATCCLLDDAPPVGEVGRCADEFEAQAVVIATEMPLGSMALSELRASIAPEVELVVVGVDLRIKSRVARGVRSLGDTRQYWNWLRSLTGAMLAEVGVA